MKKTIELSQDFIDEIVVKELQEWRSLLNNQLEEYYALPEREPFQERDIADTLRSIAAIDVVLNDYSPKIL